MSPDRDRPAASGVRSDGGEPGPDRRPSSGVRSDGGAADQRACTAAVLEAAPDAALVANLGVASWVLMDLDDRDRNLYLRGGMGSTTPTAFGLSLATDDPVVALDGDGSLLMSLGCLSTVAEYAPATLTVVVWNNGTYATTGGQPTAAVDFAAAAEACGLAGLSAASDEGFRAAFEEALAADGPALVDCVVGATDASAPERYDYRHQYLTHRFREAMVGD